MRLANLLVTIAGLVVTMIYDGMIFMFSFLAAFFGLFMLGSPSSDTEMIAQIYVVFGVSFAAIDLAVTAVILGVIAFVKSRKPGAPAKTYMKLCLIASGMMTLTAIPSYPLAAWINKYMQGSEYLYSWPIIIIPLTIAMIVLTFLAANRLKKKAAAIAAASAATAATAPYPYPPVNWPTGT